MPARLLSLILGVSGLAAPASHGDAMLGDWVVGLETRQRIQYINNSEFDAASDKEGWRWTQRLAFSADGEIADKFRARINLQSALSSGGQTSPVESNVLDFREAYFEIGPENAFVRVGRQDVLLGSQRLLGTRDGTNVRRQWNGVRGVVELGDWRVDALAVSLVDVRPDGVFNDNSDDMRLVGGVYAMGPALIGDVDIYLLYAETDDRLTIEGTADQQRYSLGARSFGERRNVFWNWEAIYQFGRHGDADISAWTLATSTGYRFDAPWSPEVELSANIASGDSAPGDGDLGTFDALYPRGNYFSDAAVLGPANFYNLNPYFRVSPTEKLDLSVDVNWFWRLEEADGLYGPPGNILRAPAGSRSGFVSTGISAGATYQLTERVSLEAIYAHNNPGDFIADTGPSDPVDFLELTLRFTL